MEAIGQRLERVLKIRFRSLVILQVLALLALGLVIAAPSAWAATTCTVSGTTRTLTETADAFRIVRNGSGIDVYAGTAAATTAGGGTLQTGTNCTGWTVDNTTAINVSEGVAGNLTIDLSGGQFASATDEIAIDWAAGGGADIVTIRGSTGADHIVAGASPTSACTAGSTVGLNLNAGTDTSQDCDLGLTSVSNVDFDLGAGADIFTGNTTSGFGFGAVSAIVMGVSASDRATGAAGNDTITGGSAADFLDGGADDDTMAGALGSDNMDGGTDTSAGDTLDCSTVGATALAVTLATTAAETCHGSDTLTAEATNDASFENVIGGTGADSITGDIDSNTLRGGAGNDGTLNGGDGNDVLIGEAGTDTLTGAAGADTLRGGADNDTENGDAGIDTFDQESASNGGDTINGGSEVDTVSYSSRSVNVVVTLNGTANDGADSDGNGTAEENDDVEVDVENVTGGAGDDTITGQTATNVANSLSGGAGFDTLSGGTGATGDTLTGGADDDIASYSTSTAAVTADLGTPANNAGDAASDTFSGIEDLLGGTGADTLRGDGNANIIDGGDGSQIDTLVGGAGRDVLVGQEGADPLTGGDGRDIAAYYDSASGVTVNLGSTGSGGDAAGDSYTTIESVMGSAGVDNITGDGNDNQLMGLDGADILSGGAGADSLLGGGGADTLNGEAGSDTLNPGSGTDNDTINGGNGDRDVVTYAQAGAPGLATTADGVTIDLRITGAQSTRIAGTDTITQVESVKGSNGKDVLDGDSGFNNLWGLNGDDALNGRGGGDRIFGGAGADTCTDPDDPADDTETNC